MASCLDELLEQVKRLLKNHIHTFRESFRPETSCGFLCAQAARVFLLSCQFLTVVLEEDGTVVDSEEFFQSLPSNTSLMVLEKGDMWTQSKVRVH